MRLRYGLTGLLIFLLCCKEQKPPVTAIAGTPVHDSLSTVADSFYYPLHTKPQLCYTSGRLRGLIEKTNGKTTSGESTRLSTEDFNSLSPKERFIYALTYPESFYQNCSLFPMYKTSMLYANLPFTEGLRPSERQFNSLLIRRDSTLAYLKHCIGEDGYISLELKYLAGKLNAVELIPVIRSVCLKGEPDNFNYTLLMLLMEQNKFPLFINTQIYRDLYSKSASYMSVTSFSTAKTDTILNLSEQLYNSRFKAAPL